MTRPAFGGHLMATIICPRFRPQMATVRPGVMQTAEFDETAAANTVIENVATDLSEKDISVEVLEVKKAATQLVDLIGADVIVAVGRGISSDRRKGSCTGTRAGRCTGRCSWLLSRYHRCWLDV